MKFTKEQEDFIEDFLQETGFEIWNSGCTHRLSCTFAMNKRFGVADYDDPLHPIKEYQSLQRAIDFMVKKDEE